MKLYYFHHLKNPSTVNTSQQHKNKITTHDYIQNSPAKSSHTTIKSSVTKLYLQNTKFMQ